jgi:hypothetical protein
MGPIFINHDNSPGTHRRADRFSADALQHAQIKPLFSDALRCVEAHMRKHSLFTRKRDDFETDTPAVLADFLRIKPPAGNASSFTTRLISVVFPHPGRPVSKIFGFTSRGSLLAMRAKP